MNQSNEKTLKTILLVIAGVLIVGIIYMFTIKQAQAPTNLPAGNTTSNQPSGQLPGGTTLSTSDYNISAPSAPLAQSKIYENKYLKVTIPAGWAYSPTASGAVNMTKNNYILYINPSATQAGMAEGGSFDGIAIGAPSADAVVTEHPTAGCGSPESHSAYGQYSRYDYYVNSTVTKTQGWCVSPSDGSTVWYFSYISSGGYYNHYYTVSDPPKSYVITMAYNLKDVNKLPKKGSAELTSMLSEMTNIVKTLELKQSSQKASIEYKNAQYGFSFTLPITWKGYSIITDKWEGGDSNDPQGYQVIAQGPTISIRHPLWTTINPRQDVPIMVFTTSQWDLMQQDKFHIGAAPFNPSELGRNAKYVFALPARYNYGSLAGYEEVDKILQGSSLHAF